MIRNRYIRIFIKSYPSVLHLSNNFFVHLLSLWKFKIPKKTQIIQSLCFFFNHWLQWKKISWCEFFFVRLPNGHPTSIVRLIYIIGGYKTYKRHNIDVECSLDIPYTSPTINCKNWENSEQSLVPDSLPLN